MAGNRRNTMKPLCFGLALAAGLAILAACAQGAAPASSPSPGAAVPAPDRELGDIAENARENLQQFLDALADPNKAASGFEVKSSFRADPASPRDQESLWLKDIRRDGGIFRGAVAEDPKYVSGLKAGDEVEFDIEQIEDWLYVDKGRIVGGASLRLQIERTPMDKRTEADEKTLAQFQ